MSTPEYDYHRRYTQLLNLLAALNHPSKIGLITNDVELKDYLETSLGLSLSDLSYGQIFEDIELAIRHLTTLFRLLGGQAEPSVSSD